MENENKSYGFGTEGDERTYGQPDQNSGGAGYGQPNQSYGQPDQNYGGTTYGQPNSNYGGTTYTQSNQSYGGAVYGQMNQGYGQPGYGGVPVGSDGQPLKNNYGLKMFFVILEFLCCCGCNIITMVLGIIAGVFNGSANRAYREGRTEDFKRNAKTSSILLWIGFGVAVFYLILCIYGWTVGGIGEDFERIFWEEYYESLDYYDYDDNDYSFDDNDAEDELADSRAAEESRVPDVPSEDVIPGDGFTDPTIIINGITIQLPLTYAEFEALGFYIGEDDKNLYVNHNEYYDVEFYSADGTEIGLASIGNETDTALPLSESVVFGFWMESIDWKYNGYTVEFPNGLDVNSSVIDFKTAYGEPDDEYESDTNDYQFYQWYNHHDEFLDMNENSIEVTFWDGELDEIEIHYIGWD